MTAHVVQYSMGAGSWATAKRVAASHGTDALWLLFCDTFAERADTYRFGIEGAFNVFGQTAPAHLLADAANLPAYMPDDERHMEGRKRLIKSLAWRVQRLLPRVVWVWDGRYPFEVFDDEHFIGSSRAGICSKILKGRVADRTVAAMFDPATTVRYVGIDWTEQHRLDKVRTVAPGWRWEAPMCDAPLMEKSGMLEMMRDEGIRPSGTYAQGFPHDNCSDLCTKGGQAHWGKVLVFNPAGFASAERWESRFRSKHGDHAILRDRRGGTTKALPLPVLRQRVEEGTQPTMFDASTCGCFMDDYEGAPAQEVAA